MRLIPELQLFPTFAERRSALASTWGDVYLFFRYLSPRDVTLLAGVILLGNVMARLHAPPLLAIGASALFWLAVAAVIGIPFVRGFRRTLRRKLVESGIPVCWQCGYDLRGLPTIAAVCPECGAASSESARRLRRILPESSAFPELTAFDSEAEAISALRSAEGSLGVLYRRRLRIGIILGVVTSIVVMMVLDGLDLAFDLDRRTEVFRPTGVAIGIAAIVWSFIGWYGWLRRRMRAHLRRTLEADSEVLESLRQPKKA